MLGGLSIGDTANSSQAEQRLGKKVEVVFNGMRLATDQAHQTAAKLTMNGQRRLLFEADELVHDADAKARVTTVNSVSLQPMFAPKRALALTHPLT